MEGGHQFHFYNLELKRKNINVKKPRLNTTSSSDPRQDSLDRLEEYQQKQERMGSQKY